MAVPLAHVLHAALEADGIVRFETKHDAKTIPGSQTVAKSEARSNQIFGPGCATHAPGNQEAICAATGSLYIPQSMVFQPALDPGVAEAAMDVVPDDIKSRKGDNKANLVKCISNEGFYDNLHALHGGNGCRKRKKRVPLNETDYSQPRRKSFSVVIKDVHLDKAGHPVRTMYRYGKQNSRIRTDATATPMPHEILELGTQCWRSIRHVLSTDVCTSSPPNHCQVLGYYGLLDSKIGRHKDDHHLGDLHRVLFGAMPVEKAVMKGKGAMSPGSDVLVYSAGPLPMLFKWCYAPRKGPFAPRKGHSVHPDMQIRLEHGSLFVFKAIDDLCFYHEVSIDWSTAELIDYRLAFVFRWLDGRHACDFPVDLPDVAVDPPREAGTPSASASGRGNEISSGDWSANDPAANMSSHWPHAHDARAFLCDSPIVSTPPRVAPHVVAPHAHDVHAAYRFLSDSPTVSPPPPSTRADPFRFLSDSPFMSPPRVVARADPYRFLSDSPFV